MRGFILSLLLGLFILIGCSSKNTVQIIENKKITKGDVFVLLVRTNKVNSNYVMTDGIYILPTEEWIAGDFSKQFGKFLFDNYLLQGEEQNWDCDDFSRACAFFASKIYHNSSIKQVFTAIPCGEFFYFKDTGEEHAINFFITLDKFNNTKLIFYEPQNQTIVHLSEMEIKTCTFWKL